MSRRANFFDSEKNSRDIRLSNLIPSNFGGRSDARSILPTTRGSSVRSFSAPPTELSFPSKLDQTNRSIMAVIRLCFFLAFWVLLGCIVFAFGKDVLNKLENDREKLRFQVDICLHEYKRKSMFLIKGNHCANPPPALETFCMEKEKCISQNIDQNVFTLKTIFMVIVEIGRGIKANRSKSEHRTFEFEESDCRFDFWTYLPFFVFFKGKQV